MVENHWLFVARYENLEEYYTNSKYWRTEYSRVAKIFALRKEKKKGMEGFLKETKELLLKGKKDKRAAVELVNFVMKNVDVISDK